MRSAGGVKAFSTSGQGNSCVLIGPCAARRRLTRRHEPILRWLYQRPSAAAPSANSGNPDSAPNSVVPGLCYNGGVNTAQHQPLGGIILARKRTTVGGFSVSGPGIDKAGYPSGDTGLSAAINFAQADSVPEGERVYVRNPGGDLYGSVERTDDGCLVYRGAS